MERQKARFGYAGIRSPHRKPFPYITDSPGNGQNLVSEKKKSPARECTAGADGGISPEKLPLSRGQYFSDVGLVRFGVLVCPADEALQGSVAVVGMPAFPIEILLGHR